MERNRDKMAESIFTLTLEILFQLTGEVVKETILQLCLDTSITAYHHSIMTWHLQKKKKAKCDDRLSFLDRSQDEDPVDQMISHTGCMASHYAVQECMAKHQEWRRCQDQVWDFKNCMQDYQTWKIEELKEGPQNEKTPSEHPTHDSAS